MGLYLVTGSLPKKSSYNEVIKVALSQCDLRPYKRETIGTETLTEEATCRLRGRSLEQSSPLPEEPAP